MPNGITRHSFEKMEVNDKLNVLFDYIHYLHETQAEQNREENQNKCKFVKLEDFRELANDLKQQTDTCDTRFKKLEWHWAKMTGITIAAVTGITLLFNYLYLSGTA